MMALPPPITNITTIVQKVLLEKSDQLGIHIDLLIPWHHSITPLAGS